MTQKSVLVLSGSPSASSRSGRLLDGLTNRLESRGFLVKRYSVFDFDPNDLVRGKSEAGKIPELIASAREASALIVGTPVYKGTFSGSLKIVLDVIPPDSLTERIGLSVATARIREQLGDTALALSGIFRFFKFAKEVPPLTFTDEEFGPSDAEELPESVRAELDRRAWALVEAIESQVRGR